MMSQTRLSTFSVQRYNKEKKVQNVNFLIQKKLVESSLTRRTRVLESLQ
jgi:hypothetical protein